MADDACLCRYLCDNYDVDHRLLPTDKAKRAQVQRWSYASEGTFGLHGLAILYARWFGSEHTAAVEAISEGLSVNIGKDMDFLEKELNKNGTKFLVGDNVTMADCMMLFSIQFILARELGTKGRKWERVNKWIQDCEATDSYLRAVKKTGHTLFPKK